MNFFTTKKQEKNNFVSIIVKVLAVCGLIVAALFVIDVIYKKYKKCMSTFQSDNCLDYTDDDMFSDCCGCCDDFDCESCGEDIEADCICDCADEEPAADAE
ncbi:MAG: hypothetical protein IJA85_05850 [Clostridia bacterium]|nr:hypothetical protein [Clostridia bacterium]